MTTTVQDPDTLFLDLLPIDYNPSKKLFESTPGGLNGTPVGIKSGLIVTLEVTGGTLLAPRFVIGLGLGLGLDSMVTARFKVWFRMVLGLMVSFKGRVMFRVRVRVNLV
jgi:hypothetical protein